MNILHSKKSSSILFFILASTGPMLQTSGVPPLREEYWPPNSLELQVRRYQDASDTLPNEQLRDQIQSREKELKPLLDRMVDEPIRFPEYDFSGLEMLADLTWGLKDKEFDRKIWIRATLRFKEFPYDIAPPIFNDLLKRFPDDAPAVFEEIAKSGNEIVKPYAREYLDKSRKQNDSSGANSSTKHSDNNATSVDSAKNKRSPLQLTVWVVMFALLLIVFLFLCFRRKSDSSIQ